MNEAAQSAEVVEKKAEPAKIDRREAIKQAISAKRESVAADKTASAVSKPRDETGKFAKTEQINSETVETEVVVEKPARKYPSSWKKDYEPVYTKLAENQEFSGILDEIDRRESEYHKGIEPYKQSASYAQAVRKLLSPFEQTYRGMGVDPLNAARELLAIDARARTGTPQEKQQILQMLAQGWGVNSAPSASGEAQPDPTLMRQIQQQTQTIQQLMGFQQTYLRDQAKRELEESKKGREFFDEPEVKAEMARILRAGLANTAAEAYDWAIAKLPAIQAKIAAKKQAEQAAKLKAEAQNKVQAAKTAAVQVKGSPTPGTSAIRSSAGKDRRALIADLVRRR